MLVRFSRLALCLACALNSCFGFRALSHYSTKAWLGPRIRSTQLNAIESPADAWNLYLQTLDAAPLITKSITAGLLFPGADFAAQALERRTAANEGKEEKPIDYARVLRFCALGLFVQAPWNHFFFLQLDKALPPSQDALTATTAIKVFVDQGIQAPIFTVIIFAFLGLTEGKSIDDVKAKLNESYGSTMIANWKLWIPASAINLAFCPPQLRVLFTNVVFFCWSIFLSLVVNSPSDAAAETKES